MIAIIDYRAGNIGSIQGALANLGVANFVTADPAKILAADGVIFPGQGRAGSAMTALMTSRLASIIPKISRPFLGICLGLQLLTQATDEDNTTGLGVFSGYCRKFPQLNKVPHMGWNAVNFREPSPLFAGISDQSEFYFVHSFYCDKSEPSIVTATTDYGFPFIAALTKGNFHAVQFHPEKSGPKGLQLLENFAELC
ncbi:MAG: imidazole glycerol phosphate synthase subunit HisH [Deltaproteobacteria bacterium]